MKTESVIVVLLMVMSLNVFGQGFLTFPTDYSPTTQPRCSYNCYLYKSGNPHGANDYSVEKGTNVYAAASGLATAHYYPNTTGDGSYGYMIIITHANGYATRYAHLSGYTTKIKNDQASIQVEQGELIAYSGNSGGPWKQADGNYRSPFHLHYEVRKDGNTVDPYDLNNYLWTTNPPSLAVLSLIGHFSDGWHTDGTSQAILDEYNRQKSAGHNLGVPKSNNNGGVFAHEYNGIIIQDFYGENNGYNNPWSAIILNTARTTGYTLKEGFRGKYLNENGPTNLGALESNEHPESPYQSVQHCKKGTMTWNGTKVDIAQGEYTVFIATIPTSEITITSSPSGAEIWNAGLALGRTPVVGQYYQGYTYNMVAKLAGYEDKAFSFTVGSSSNTVNVSLTAGSGGSGAGNGYQLSDVFTCKGVTTDGDPEGVWIDKEQNFTGSDLYTYCWVDLDYITVPIDVKVEWYRPDGVLCQSDAKHVEPITRYHFYPQFRLVGAMEGDWQIKIYINGEYKRGLVFNLKDTEVNILYVNKPRSRVLDFSFDQTKQYFEIANGGSGMLDCWVTTDAPWLTLKYEQIGYHAINSTSIDTVYVNRSGLTDGDYVGHIFLDSNGGRDTLTVKMQKHNYIRKIFYPCSDGYTSSSFNTWSMARTQSVGYGAATTQTIADNPGSAQCENSWKISRGSVCFNTNSLGSGVRVISATLGLYFAQKNGNDQDYYHIVSSGQTNPLLLTKEDYGKFGATSFASVLTNNVSFTSYTLFALNTAGVANINPTGFSNFGMRIGSDLNNQQPNTAPYNCGLRAYMSEYGSRMPYLEVVYEPPPLEMTLSPTTLNFGSTATVLPLTITSNTNWTLTKSASWLSCGTMSGTGNAVVNINVDRDGLALGEATSTLTVTGANKSLTVSVTVTKLAPPVTTTIRFYVTQPGDGYAGNYWGSWSTIRNATNGGGNPPYTQSIADNFGSARYDAGNGGWGVNRGLFGFNTASLPDNAVITNATVGIWFQKRNGTSDDSWHIVAGSQASLATLSAADYSRVNNVSLANIQVSAATFGSYTVFPLNATGIANINKTGDTKFATRLGCDLNNVCPSTPFECGLRVYMFEYGSQMPYLEITYTVPLAKEVTPLTTEPVLSTGFMLNHNYPNPFNPETRISYNLPEQLPVTLIIYDLQGKEVERLLSGQEQTAGGHSIVWRPDNLPSGTYFCWLMAGDQTQTKKMLYLK